MKLSIAFDMTLAKTGDKVRTFEYKALSLKGIKKGDVPKFIVVEKGVGVIHFTAAKVKNGEDENIDWVNSDKSDFTKEEMQMAIMKIYEGIFKAANARGIL